jgi:hypothetical protein
MKSQVQEQNEEDPHAGEGVMFQQQGRYIGWDQEIESYMYIYMYQ